MMNKAILEQELNRKKIPKDLYNLDGGLPNEALCLNVNYVGAWEVYYSERGIKSGLKIFQTESEACNYFFEKVLKMSGENRQ